MKNSSETKKSHTVPQKLAEEVRDMSKLDILEYLISCGSGAAELSPGGPAGMAVGCIGGMAGKYMYDKYKNDPEIEKSTRHKAQEETDQMKASRRADYDRFVEDQKTAREERARRRQEKSGGPAGAAVPKGTGRATTGVNGGTRTENPGIALEKERRSGREDTRGKGTSAQESAERAAKMKEQENALRGRPKITISDL